MHRSPVSWALAPALVGAVLWLQLSAELPDAGVRALALLAADAAAIAAWFVAHRSMRAGGALALVAVAAAAWAWAAWCAAVRLDDRLPSELEGVELRLTGVIDELPVALARGHRFTLSVEACDLAPARAGTSRRREGRGARRSARGAAETAAARPAAAAAAAADREGDLTAAHGADGVTADGGTADGVTADNVTADGRGADEPTLATGAPEGVSASCRAPSRVSLSWQSNPRDSASTAPTALAAGQRWSLGVRLKRPHAPVNPGAFDRELRWLQDGIGAVGTVRDGGLVDERVPGAMLAVERLRGRIRDGLYAAAGPERRTVAGVLAALAIGDQAAIDPGWWTVFNKTGIGHLVSISGLHITMLAGVVGAATGWLWRRPVAGRMGIATRVPAGTARLLAAVGAAFAYALLAGWGIPARRTCFMLAAAALLVASGRAASIVAAVGAAAAAIVVLDPWAPLAAGFWLSFGGVLAIVWVDAARRRDDGPVRRAARGAIRAQWAATLALLPLGAWFFASVSLVGPLANAFAIPLVSAVITPLALAGGALSLASPEAAGWLVAPAGALMQWLVDALTWLSAWTAAAVPLPRPGLGALALATAGCGLLLAPAGLPRRTAGAFALLPLVAAPLDRPGPGELRLTALDVGQGTAVVVQVGARVLLYDAGPTLGPSLDTGTRTIVPWLLANGIPRLDALVVSHLDDDHAGGALSVIRATPPDLLVSSLPDSHPIVAAAARAQRCRRGEGWRWDDVEFEWLHPADPPEPARGSPSNAVSCVLRVRAPGGTVLLPGDIEAAQERRLVALYGAEGLAADVLLVPHHGSLTSSTEYFVDAVSPRWAIVQAAYRSRFRHPHPRVVERYERRGVDLLRSDADGAIRMSLRPGVPPEIVRFRNEPARYWRIEASPP